MSSRSATPIILKILPVPNEGDWHWRSTRFFRVLRPTFELIWLVFSMVWSLEVFVGIEWPENSLGIYLEWDFPSTKLMWTNQAREKGRVQQWDWPRTKRDWRMDTSKHCYSLLRSLWTLMVEKAKMEESKETSDHHWRLQPPLLQRTLMDRASSDRLWLVSSSWTFESKRRD